MNKYQSIVLIIGFVLISLTWVWGSSQFKVGEHEGRIYKNIPIMEQRIEKETLQTTIIYEIFFLVILVVILKKRK